MAREVTALSERDFVRSRYNIWVGSAEPKTIVIKEMCDNAIDQIADGKATKAVISIKPELNEAIIMDNGGGISLNKDKKTGKTHLLLAIGKLYTSSNYSGTENVVGTNGVGSTVANFLSKYFIAGQVTNNHFKGYKFNDGSLEGDSNSFYEYDEAFPMANGFYVHFMIDNNTLIDYINFSFLNNYIKMRTGELPEGSVIDFYFGDESHEYTKIKNDVNYVKSWEEKVNDIPGSSICTLRNGWKYAFSKHTDDFKDVPFIIQGAPVDNSREFRGNFVIEKTNNYVNIPYTLYYSGKENPKYTDQTKVRISLDYSVDKIAMLKKTDINIYNHFYKKAEENYLTSVLKTTGDEMFWPAISKNDDTELIIAEGYSAITGIKAQRDPHRQACLAIRGKILNVMQKTINDAMKSPIVKEIITVLTHYKFNKIIIATDSDPSGMHICTLLLGLLSRFLPHYLENKQVYFCHTPLYVFDKKGQPIQWSDDPNDCPNGYHISVKKGLGSLTSTEVEKFIIDDSTRDLWQFDYDNPEADEMLNFALVQGGKGWINDGEEE
jgi:DNA gyrase/topoisomerase IV subunit B